MAAISKCGSGRCQFYTRGSLDEDIYFSTSVTNKKFEVDFDATCITCCIIYLITCKCCTMQYVGKSLKSVRTRFNDHRGNIRNRSEALVMLEHFHDHGVANMVIRPIELCTKENLKERESFWIGELSTLFHYGLNMGGRSLPCKLKNTYTHVMQNKDGVPIYSGFNVIKNEGDKRGLKSDDSVNINTSLNDFDPDVWYQQLIGNVTDGGNLFHSLRTTIFKLKQPYMKLLFLDNAKKMMDGNLTMHQKHMYIHYVIRGLCICKLQKSFKKPNRTFIVIDHVNKLVDKMNISQMINCDGLFEITLSGQVRLLFFP